MTENGTVFPATYSILSAAALSERINPLYRLSASVRCDLLRPGLNDTYLVLDGDARYILRVYRRGWRSHDEISFELDLLRHLSRKGISLSLPVPDRDGRLIQSLLAPEGQRHMVLFSHASGRALSWESPEESRLLGRVAAAIHLATEDFVSAYPRSSLDLDYLLEAPCAGIRPFLSHRLDDLHLLGEVASQLRERLETAKYKGLDWGICHGDLATKNVRLGDDGVPVVFDFDLCGPGWRAYDLAAAPYRALHKKHPANWHAFLDGYTDVRTLSDVDRDAVPLFSMINHVWSLGLYARNAQRWGSLPMNDRYLDGHIDLFRQWMGEWDDAA